MAELATSRQLQQMGFRKPEYTVHSKQMKKKKSETQK